MLYAIAPRGVKEVSGPTFKTITDAEFQIYRQGLVGYDVCEAEQIDPALGDTLRIIRRIGQEITSTADAAAPGQARPGSP